VLVKRAIMNIKLVSFVFAFAFAFLADSISAAGNDNPLLFMLDVQELEFRDTYDGEAFVWRGQAWLGRDRDKALLKSRGESNSDSTEEFELQALYSRAIDRYWDLELGLRHDFQPVKDRQWLVMGLQGIAPFFIQTDAAFFLGDSGRTGIRIRGSYEMLLTNRWELQPEVELNWYGKDDEVNGIGSGISNLEASLRLRYIFSRKFIPYAGLSWEKGLGDTAGYIEAGGGDSSDIQALAGFRFWF
jgi:copper resistance protein B